MKSFQHHSPSVQLLRGGLLALVMGLTPWAQAAPTLWTGPMLNYSQPDTDPTQPANQDRITSRVWLTRGPTQGIFNKVTEDSYDQGTFKDPTDTEWSFGSIEDYASLTYTTWAGMSKPPNMVNQPAVLHLITDDIYLSVTFTFWGGSSGGFAYVRSTPAVASPPTVSLTSPSAGTVYAAPANVQLTASATASGGTVTNVQYFARTTSLGHATAAPFSVTGSLPAAGNYALTAVATAGGLSATSAVANISVVTPVVVTLSSPRVRSNQFVFSYTANPGLSYVVQSSSNLVNWSSVVTNIAAGNAVSITNSFISNSLRFYRVGRLPNP